MKQNNYKTRTVIHGLSMAMFLGACLGVQADDNKGIAAQATVNTDDRVEISKDRDAKPSDRINVDVDRADSGKLSRSDAKFVREAADGGLLEVKMGQIAKDRGAHAEVKSYGERLVKDHTKANETLAKLAAQKGVNLAKEMEPKKMGLLKDLDNKSGADFDKTFIEHALKDHKKCVFDFEKASRELNDTELRSFAMETLPTLREHYDDAQRIARSLGLAVTAVDTSDYQRDAELNVNAAAGSPGISVEKRDSSLNQGARVDVDVDRDRDAAAETKVEVNTAKGDGQTLGVDTTAGDNKTLGVETRQGDNKVLGIQTGPGDGKTLGLNTQKDDGKYLGIIPKPGANKAEKRVDVDIDTDRDASIAVGAPATTDKGTAKAEVNVETDTDNSAVVSYSDIPQAVQDTIKAHGGAADAKVRKHTDLGKTVFSAQIRKDGRDSKLKIAEDGTVIKDNNK